MSGAKYFSHYNHGDNGHKGECGCFGSCSWPGKFDCRNECDDDDDDEQISEELEVQNHGQIIVKCLETVNEVKDLDDGLDKSLLMSSKFLFRSKK